MQFQNCDTSNEEHKAKLSHEVIGGAAAYEVICLRSLLL